jgi:hypothetical protein
VIKYGIATSYASKNECYFLSDKRHLIYRMLQIKYGAGGIRQPYFYISFFPNFATERRINNGRKRTKDGNRK